jgi:hypothetical protein
MLFAMTSEVFGKIGRGCGWVGVTAVSFLLAVVMGILPLSLLPGPVHTDFVHGQWIKLAGLGFVGAILIWPLSPVNQNIRLTPQVAGRFIWLATTAFMLAFWPIGLAIWFNAHNSRGASVHDMVVIGVESATIRPAVTPVESYDLRDLSTGWAANLEVTEQRKQFVVPGRCVRIVVRKGRLGLDWISDAKPISCPA